MYRLLVLAALASACDQGAHAAPTSDPVPVAPTYERYTVRDDADFVVKARAILAEMTQVFETKDCERLARQITQFGEGSVTRFAVLTDYGESHPALQKQIEPTMKPEVEALMKVMMSALTPCMSDQRVTTALQTLSQLGNLTQQRPR